MSTCRRQFTSYMNPQDLERRPCDGIDLWYVRTDEPLAADAARQLEQLLSKQEITTSQRFRSKRHSDAYQLAHGMVRLALSHYLGAAPESLVFETGRYGKPALVGQGGQHLAFSLSHTAGIAVCAVATSGPIGVDIEGNQRDGQLLEVARHHFAPSEVTRLEQLAPGTAASEALELWTL